MIADAGKRYTLVPEETIPSKAKSVKSLTSFAKRSAQLAAGFVCAIALAAGVPTVAGAQVLTTDNVCGKTADARGITAENLPDIDATNALVMGKDGTVYYARGADEQVKIASITKVMTAILTVENCKMDEKVTVSNAAATVGNSTAGLLEGDELTVEQALRGLMIPSGNDAAIVLAEYMGKKIDPKTKDAEATFVKAMNERAKKLGCTGTLFENPHGLDFDEWAGDMHSTAHDVALMMQEAMKNATNASPLSTRNPADNPYIHPTANRCLPSMARFTTIATSVPAMPENTPSRPVPTAKSSLPFTKTKASASLKS